MQICEENNCMTYLTLNVNTFFLEQNILMKGPDSSAFTKILVISESVCKASDWATGWKPWL